MAKLSNLSECWCTRMQLFDQVGKLQERPAVFYSHRTDMNICTVTGWVCPHARQDSWWTATTQPAQCLGNVPSVNLLWAWISLQKTQAWQQWNNLVVLSSNIVGSQKHVVEVCRESVPVNLCVRELGGEAWGVSVTAWELYRLFFWKEKRWMVTSSFPFWRQVWTIKPVLMCLTPISHYRGDCN